MTDTEGVCGSQLVARIRFSIPEEDKSRHQLDVQSAFTLTGIEVTHFLWSVNAVGKYTLEVTADNGKFTGETVFTLVEMLAQCSDADNVDIKIADILGQPLIQAHWFEDNLTVLELHPQLYDVIPCTEHNTKFWLGLLFNHVWMEYDPIIDSRLKILARKKVREQRTKTLAADVNRVLKSMDCREIDMEQLEKALLPYVQPKWSKQ